MDKLPDELIRKIVSYNDTCIYSKDSGIYFSNTYYFKFLKCGLLNYKKNYITGKYKDIDIFNQTCYVLIGRKIITKKKCTFCMGYTEKMINKISEIIFNIYRYENCSVKIYPTPYWELLHFDTTTELQDCLRLIYKCKKIKIKKTNYQKYIDYYCDLKAIKIRPKIGYYYGENYAPHIKHSSSSS